jgi:hypothetical protein
MDFNSVSPLKPAVFGLTQPELEPMIHNTRDEQAYSIHSLHMPEIMSILKPGLDFISDSVFNVQGT